MTIKDDVLHTLKPQAYKTIRGRVRDGDLLFCSATDPISQTIRWATRSPWSHIAIAYRLEALDRVMVLESVEHIGVRTVPLSTFISRTSEGTHPYPGDIILARHAGFPAGEPGTMKEMFRFAFDHLGDKFAMGEIFKILTRIVLGRFAVHMPKSLGAKNEYICSEYVAKCFDKVGLKIPWDGLGFIGPGDFAADPEIKVVARFRTR